MLYRVQKQDIKRAATVLADAFQRDPLWNKLYEGEPNTEKRFCAFFEGSVRYCMKYGEVYAPSEDLEGIMGWNPGKLADVNWWRGIRCGSVGLVMRMGMSTVMKMQKIFKPITEDRQEHMAGHDYLYLSVIGVATGLQGKGFGRKLLDAAIEKTQREGLQLYLDTETEENVKMYKHFGFKLLKKVTLPILELPMWEMVREPQV